MGSGRCVLRIISLLAAAIVSLIKIMPFQTLVIAGFYVMYCIKYRTFPTRIVKGAMSAGEHAL